MFVSLVNERGGMKTYIFLLRNNAEGAKAMLTSGSSGAAGQADVVRELGGECRHQWAVTGRYDAVLVADLPDDAAALALTLGATAGGQYIELLSALDTEVLDSARDRYDQAAAALIGEPANVQEPRVETSSDQGDESEI